jgi:hypothetical protein
MNVEALAEVQYGLVTRTQAGEYLSPNAIDRRVRSHRFVAVFPGVYRIAGAPVTARQRALATTLWADPARVSHLVAGRLLRLPMPRPEQIDVIVEHRRAWRLRA